MTVPAAEGGICRGDAVVRSGAHSATDGRGTQMHKLTNISEQTEKPLFMIVPARERLIGAAITFSTRMIRSRSVQWNKMTPAILRNFLQSRLLETDLFWLRLRWRERDVALRRINPHRCTI
jgi:hypothetical protein